MSRHRMVPPPTPAGSKQAVAAVDVSQRINDRLGHGGATPETKDGRCTGRVILDACAATEVLGALLIAGGVPERRRDNDEGSSDE